MKFPWSKDSNDSEEKRRLKVRFISPKGQANVRSDFDEMVRDRNGTLSGANCFFTEPGRRILARHIERIKDGGFFVASVAPPTNLDALLALHNEAPGDVYIHLGGSVPREAKVGRALMHSKCFLCDNDGESTLWVGSHNLTASAFAGANFEAATIIEGLSSEEVFVNARMHLERCKTTAEAFNPEDMDRYRDIQRGWGGGSGWETEKDVFVIHAEGEEMPEEDQFILHVNLSTAKLDRKFSTERAIRLFLHPPETLAVGKAVDISHCRVWKGVMTAVVRTERHPRNQGTKASFARADFQIDIGSLRTGVPRFCRAQSAHASTQTQVIVRIDGQSVVGSEVYSVDKRHPVDKTLVSGGSLENLDEVDKDLLEFFDEASIVDGHLVYRAAKNLGDTLMVVGFEETRSSVQKAFNQMNAASFSDGQSRSDAKSPSYPIEPFFFLSKYVVRSNK